mgnify:FL=1
MAKSLVDILVESGDIPEDQGSRFKREAKDKKISLEEELYQQGLAEDVVLKAKSALYKIPSRSLQGFRVPLDLLRSIPEESAKFYKFIPIDKQDTVIEIGILNPDDAKAREALTFIANRLGLEFKLSLITPHDMEEVLKEYKTLGGEVTKAISQFESEAEVKITQMQTAKKASDAFVDEAPITKMVSVVLRHAVEGRASDIHIEPETDNVRVRFRVDGILYTSLVLPKEVQSAVVTRIKVMTNMKIDETRIPQDGRFQAEINGRKIDFRVASLPTALGEKIAIRILDPDSGVKTLEDLGISGRNLDVVKNSLQRPYGLVLITGPTGSGKSTSLYAMLQILNEEKVNIISLEDPIEYFVAGVNQSQIRPEIGYDFATGLRNILRQDPDIILVGEIRDKETAALAIHAALTGHLVISTLHTNDVVGVIPRLVDLGVDPFLIAPTLILTIGQRLVPKLCAESRKAIELTGRVKEVMSEEVGGMPENGKKEANLPAVKEIYQAQTSGVCPKGTRGRIGVFEVLETTPQLAKIILEGGSALKIQDEANRQGMVSMHQDGILKVLKGIIGLEELKGVI